MYLYNIFSSELKSQTNRDFGSRQLTQQQNGNKKMKNHTKNTMNRFKRIARNALITLPLCAIGFALLVTATARGQTYYVSNLNGLVLGEVNAAGATVHTTAPPNSGWAAGLAVSGNTLYVAEYINNTLGSYDATTGAVITGPFTISTTTSPFGLAVALPAPEPATWLLLAVSLGSLTTVMVLRRRRSRI